MMEVSRKELIYIKEIEEIEVNIESVTEAQDINVYRTNRKANSDLIGDNFVVCKTNTKVICK